MRNKKQEPKPKTNRKSFIMENDCQKISGKLLLLKLIDLISREKPENWSSKQLYDKKKNINWTNIK